MLACSSIAHVCACCASAEILLGTFKSSCYGRVITPLGSMGTLCSSPPMSRPPTRQMAAERDSTLLSTRSLLGVPRQNLLRVLRVLLVLRRARRVSLWGGYRNR